MSKRLGNFLCGVALGLAGVVLGAQNIAIPNTFSNGTVADANQVNANFSALAANAVNRTGGTFSGTPTPTADNTVDLGSAALRFGTVYGYHGNWKGNTILGDAAADTVTVNGTITSDLIATDNTYDIGKTATTRFRDFFLARNATIGGTLGVTGATTLSSTLGVTGTATLAGLIGGVTTIVPTDTGTQNDYAPGLVGHTILRLNNASLLTITGFAGGTAGQRLTLISIGAGQVDLAHQAGGSTAANRLVNFATSGNTSLAAGVGVAEYVYDGTTARWRLVRHEQGAWITPAFSAGNFVAAGGGTVTVASGDVSRYAFYLVGRQLSVSIVLDTFSYSTPGYGVSITVPGGYSAVGVTAELTARVGNNSTTTVMGRVDVGTTTVTVRVDMVEGAANVWTASTDNSSLRVSATIAVS